MDGTGTSPELLEAVANAMVSNVERFELLEQMIATVQVSQRDDHRCILEAGLRHTCCHCARSLLFLMRLHTRWVCSD